MKLDTLSMVGQKLIGNQSNGSARGSGEPGWQDGAFDGFPSLLGNRDDLIEKVLNSKPVIDYMGIRQFLEKYSEVDMMVEGEATTDAPLGDEAGDNLKLPLMREILSVEMFDAIVGEKLSSALDAVNDPASAEGAATGLEAVSDEEIVSLLEQSKEIVKDQLAMDAEAQLEAGMPAVVPGIHPTGTASSSGKSAFSDALEARSAVLVTGSNHSGNGMGTAGQALAERVAARSSLEAVAQGRDGGNQPRGDAPAMIRAVNVNTPAPIQVTAPLNLELAVHQIASVAKSAQAAAAQSGATIAEGQAMERTIQSLEVQLAPRSLGGVQIRIETNGQMMNIMIETQSREAMKLLSSEMKNLVRTLQNVSGQGLVVETSVTHNPQLELSQPSRVQAASQDQMFANLEFGKGNQDGQMNSGDFINPGSDDPQNHSADVAFNPSGEDSAERPGRDNRGDPRTGVYL